MVLLITSRLPKIAIIAKFYKGVKMKSVFSVLILGFVAFIIGACSSENTALNGNECPQNALCIYKSVSISQAIIPNAYKANIRITESDTLRKGGEIEPSTKKDIADTLNDIISLSKKQELCEGGNHDLRPNIQYKDGAARDTVGYTLNFNLECNVPSKKKKEYDSFVADIDKKINKNKYLSFLAPNVNIIATPESLQEAQDKAFENALTFAKQKEGDYSRIVNKKCILSGADSMNAPLIQPKFALTRAESSNTTSYADTSWELPTPKEQEITAKVQVKYICK